MRMSLHVTSASLTTFQVLSITPNEGSFSGGTAVTITGSGFTGATSVVIDEATLTDFVVVNDTTITGTTTFNNNTGTYDVVVNKGLLGSATGVGLFTGAGGG